MPFKDPKSPANAERLRAYRRKHYRRNKAAYINRTVAKRREMEVIYREAKARPCADCDAEYPPWVMQFDHLGDKEDLVRAFLQRGNLKAMLAEIKKCDVVCANCHCQRTHDRLIAATESMRSEELTLF